MSEPTGLRRRWDASGPTKRRERMVGRVTRGGLRLVHAAGAGASATKGWSGVLRYSSGSRPGVWRGRVGLVALLVVGGLGLNLALAPAAHAAPTNNTFTVTDCANANGTAGTLNLDTALTDAQQPGESGDTINFSCGSTTGPLMLDQTLSITTTLTIDGGKQNISLDGNHARQDIVVQSGASLTLDSLTIQNGSSSTNGGGISVAGAAGTSNAGMLALNTSTVANNSANSGDGGGIYNAGMLALNTSTVANNSAGNGGGIANEGGGTAILNTSTIGTGTVGGAGGGNSASSGGGIYSDSGMLIVTNSTVGGNSAGDGGGIVTNASAQLINSTVSFNAANGGGAGGIDNQGTLTLNASTVAWNNGSEAGGINNGGQLTLTNSTVANNTAPTGAGGIFSLAPVTPTSSGSIVADNNGVSSEGNCGGTTLADGGYNLENATDCGFSTTNHSLPNTDPLLATQPLANNGGPTLTLALPSTSPAIDAIPTSNSLCQPPDQRGVARPGDSGETTCDIGAYEYVDDGDLGLTGVPANITVTATSASGAVVTYTPPTATDESGDSPTASVSCLPDSGSTFAIATTTVTCTAMDSDDTPSSASASFTVTVTAAVTDTDLVLTNVPANITVNATSASGAVVTYTSPTVVDEDSPLPQVSCLPASGSTFPIGTTKVTCTVSASGDTNSPVSASFQVVVVKGAAAQVSDLLTTVNGYTHPSLTATQKTTLNNKLRLILAEINGGQKALACTNLTGFIGYVKAQTGKGGITAARATALIAAAKNVQAALGC